MERDKPHDYITVFHGILKAIFRQSNPSGPPTKATQNGRWPLSLPRGCARRCVAGSSLSVDALRGRCHTQKTRPFTTHPCCLQAEIAERNWRKREGGEAPPLTSAPLGLVPCFLRPSRSARYTVCPWKNILKLVGHFGDVRSGRSSGMCSPNLKKGM